MTTDDYSCQEENDTHSGGSPPPSNNDHGNTADVPFEILDPADREGCALLRNKLDTLLDLVSKNNERREGTNMAKCIVDLVQANERLVQANQLLNAQGTNMAKRVVELVQANERLVQATQLLNTQVTNGREENLRLRQENDALKASAELKSTVENLTAQVERLDLEATKNELIDNLSEKHDQEREEMKSSLAELKDCLRVELKNDMNSSLKRLEQEHYEKFDANKRAFEQLIVTFNEKNDELKSSILNRAAKNHDELKSSMAAMQEKLRLEHNNAGVEDTTNQDTNEGETMCSIPSQTTTFLWRECDNLDFEPWIFGNKYKWSIKVVSTGGYLVELGVASTIHKLNVNKWLGNQNGGWSYDSDGYACHANNKIKSNLPRFKDGSKLTFILDLTGDGTLSVYHDDDASNLNELFSNMKSGMDVNANQLVLNCRISIRA